MPDMIFEGLLGQVCGIERIYNVVQPRNEGSHGQVMEIQNWELDKECEKTCVYGDHPKWKKIKVVTNNWR